VEAYTTLLLFFLLLAMYALEMDWSLVFGAVSAGKGMAYGVLHRSVTHALVSCFAYARQILVYATGHCSNFRYERTKMSLIFELPAQ